MIRAVLFDLDGTLADTAQDLGAALNRLLQDEGKAPLAYEQVRPVAPHGARGLIRLGFGIDVDHPQFNSLRQRFLDNYDTSFADLTTIFDGINFLLEQLAQRGISWGVVTNKPMRFTDRLVPALPWSVPPGVIVSGDTVGVPPLIDGLSFGALIADAAHLQDHVDRGLKVSDDLAKAKLGALGHHQKRQPVHGLAGRMGVQRGEGPRMPGIDRI